MKIGISVPLSAPHDADIRSVGNDVSRSVELAQEVLGTGHELIQRDNCNSRQRGAEVIEEFARLGVDAVLGLPTSDEVFNAVDALAAAKLPAITSMATSPDLARFPNIFRTRPGDRHACEVLVEYLAARRNDFALVATITEDYAYPRDCTRELVAKGCRAGLRFESREYTTHREDVRGLLEELRQHHPRALFVSTQNEEGFDRVLRQAREVLGDIQILGSAMPGSRLFRTLAGDLANGIIYVSEPSLEQVLTERGGQLLEAFRVQYGDPETGDYAIALTHAAFYALDRAGAAAGAIAENLGRMTFDDPALGRFRFVDNEITSQFEPGGRNRFAGHRIMLIEEGQARAL